MAVPSGAAEVKPYSPANDWSRGGIGRCKKKLSAETEMKKRAGVG